MDFDIIRAALEEDIGSGDITTNLCVPAGRMATARMIARERMVVAGTELLQRIVGQKTGRLLASGTLVEGETVIAEYHGPARQLLTTERTALNFIQRLSGIATLARQFVEAVAATKTKILDTRKTTPGLRRLEKMAAAAGGVINHRMGLYDAVLIKNNHIVAAGGITKALQATGRAGVDVEIEVRTRAELDEALAAGAQHLLLDNLTPEQAREWIAYIDGRATVELSGRITLETVRAFALAGPDYISSGALTHSARAMDINLRLELD